MKLTINSDEQLLRVEINDTTYQHPLYSREAFEIVSREWVRMGWSLGYYQTFTWLGSPILQMPEDVLRLQEALYVLKPTLIIETGVHLGGSVLLHASILALLGGGRVIGIEKELLPAVRERLRFHDLGKHISLIEGDSIGAATLQTLKRSIRPNDKVMVILDSDHSAGHVARELRAYAPLVTPGSCLLVEDAIMADLTDVPGGSAEWRADHPGTAVREFLTEHGEFQSYPPAWLFNPTQLGSNITYWPEGWLWRRPAP